MSHASREQHEFLDALGRLTPRDHICLLYENREEQFAAAIPFMRMGLERKEQCVYIADENTPEAVMDALRAEGVDVAAAIQAGALSILTKRETYLKGGSFDPDRMVRSLAEAIRIAKRAGFAALRATGEMTWALAGDPGFDRLLEYEAKTNRFIADNDILAMCQYNNKRFRPAVMLDVLGMHPRVVFDAMVCQNPFYIPPNESVSPPA